MDFVIKTIIEVIFFALILVGIWKEEKLIAFEDKLADKLAWYTAQVIVARHRIKAGQKPHLVLYKDKPEESDVA